MEKVLGGIPEKPHTSYLSRYEIGEQVDLDFQNSKYLKNCIVESVKFTDYGKVLYDIKVPLGYENFITLYDIDSALVVEPIN